MRRKTCLVIVATCSAFGIAMRGIGAPDAVLQIIKTPLDEIVGWYEVEPGRIAPVTWRSAGGLWLADLPALRIDSLLPDGPETLGWDRAPGDQRSLHIRRDRDGAVASLEWIDEHNESHQMPRVTDPPYEQRQISYRSSDGVELIATVMIARSETPGPGAVLIQGSGDSPRDNQWALTFADYLARHGVSVLYPDKRGSGQSGGDWTRANMQLRADDAIAAMRALRSFDRINDSLTGFIGLSQGGWVAPVAATAMGDTAFNISVSGTVLPFRAQFRHELKQDFMGAGVDHIGVGPLMELLDLSLQWASTGERWDEYVARRAELITDPALDAIVSGFPETQDDPRLVFTRHVVDFDPRPAWIALCAPSLLVYGAKDEQDNIPISATIGAIKDIRRRSCSSEMTVVVYPGLGHALIDDNKGWVSDTALDQIANWIHLHSGLVKGEIE